MKEHTLSQVWTWTVYVVASSRADSPIAIHSRSGDRGDRDDLGVTHEQVIGGLPFSRSFLKRVTHEQVIGGLPFSRSFLKRVDHELPQPIRNALQACKPLRTDHQTVREARKAQWRVVAAVVKDGETDTEVCRKRLGMTETTFNAAALGGLLAFRSALERGER